MPSRLARAESIRHREPKSARLCFPEIVRFALAARRDRRRRLAARVRESLGFHARSLRESQAADLRPWRDFGRKKGLHPPLKLSPRSNSVRVRPWGAGTA